MWFRRETNSIFYVDSDVDSFVSIDNIKMETEVRTLKEELLNTRMALRNATRKCRDLVKELDNRTVGQESERLLRDQQLSRILRALLVLEARLKQEQKSIRQLLCEKDNVIRNQQLEIAKLRRYTKNYIKNKRDQNFGNVDDIADTSLHKSPALQDAIEAGQDSSSLSKDIEKLKREIIIKLNPLGNRASNAGELDRGLKKTHSFAGSDVSKTSLTSSENTDGSIITTTTDGSPSLLSTEGFCEGESTDASLSSTLDKFSRCTPTTVTDSENETTMICNVVYENDDYKDDEDDGLENNDGDEGNDDDDNRIDDDNRKDNVEQTSFPHDSSRFTKKRPPISVKCKTYKNHKEVSASSNSPKIVRIGRKDGGLYYNVGSENEEKEEPVYVNACNDNNLRNIQHTEAFLTTVTTPIDEQNNKKTGDAKADTQEQKLEETSGNWYSDPDEDKISDDVFRHSSYRPSNNHNSVLECVNQILLRDMEEEENILSVTRRFKHRGRIVRFQPAKLSDIESVGSEMERKNSDDAMVDKETSNGGFNGVFVGNFEATTSEDEFGMKIVSTPSADEEGNIENSECDVNQDTDEPKAIPIVIIEPKFHVKQSQTVALASSMILSNPPPVKMPERVEEKTGLQISAQGLTIAKNLDYEDIESLPRMQSPPPLKTPPALPPKPQFRNNTLILKKIPSPSFLIDETRKKQQLFDGSAAEHGKKIFNLLSSPLKSSKSAISCVRSLHLDDRTCKPNEIVEEDTSWQTRFHNVRSSFQVRRNVEPPLDQCSSLPRVTNIVRQFEEFKIGPDTEDPLRIRNRQRGRHVEVEQELDIRQNFEEFNLDECDLSLEPDRAEADGSERMRNFGSTTMQNESVNGNKDGSNVSNIAKNMHTGYDNFLEATGLCNKSILTPSRLLSNHKSMLKPKDIKYKNKIKATAGLEKHSISSNNTVNSNTNSQTHVRHWTGPFV